MWPYGDYFITEHLRIHESVVLDLGVDFSHALLKRSSQYLNHSFWNERRFEGTRKISEVRHSLKVTRQFRLHSVLLIRLGTVVPLDLVVQPVPVHHLAIIIVTTPIFMCP